MKGKLERSFAYLYDKTRRLIISEGTVRSLQQLTQGIQEIAEATGKSLQDFAENKPNNGDKMERVLEQVAGDKPVRFTSQQLVTVTGNFSQRLGSGGFGLVYGGRFSNGVNVAVKILKDNEQQAEEQFMAEVITIGKTHHINLVKLYGFCHEKSIRALVYEFMENGSLDKYLYTPEETPIGLEKLYEIAIGTAKGLSYLHEDCQQRIIHYDIKPANILLDGNFNPKLADFGLAKLSNREDTHVTMSGYRGTPGYSAPEVLLQNMPVTYKCDVYSFGMMLFEMIGRRKNTNVVDNETLDWFPQRVWEGYQKGELVILLSKGWEVEDLERLERMAMVALWCVQESPKLRPPMSSVVRMLDGGGVISPPSNPFRYLSSLRMHLEDYSGSGSSEPDNSSGWFKESHSGSSGS